MRRDINKSIIETEEFVKKALSGEGSGHDWWHIVRVRNMAKTIAQKEKDVDICIIELASLLHDIADRKLNDGNVDKGVKKVNYFLDSISVDQKIIENVCEIIKTCSFASSFMPDGARRIMQTIEGKIVQDADRLDALGAIGIARTFAYGGSKGREIYNPQIAPHLPLTYNEYTKTETPSLNHFYEKLLLLKDLMNTSTAKKIATKRHVYIEQYLKEFYEEWNGIV